MPTPPEVAVLLEKLAADTGDPAFARAARAIFQVSPGRPAVNDAAAIAEAEEIFESGRARSLNAAFMQVAAAVSPYGNLRSVAERLRRKHGAKNYPTN